VFGYRYARYLQRAAAGESFLVTRRGRPMARISPPVPSCVPATEAV
jgi:antitoxin (DNA-binding transcriptional repressor) of toxin-antitoxin stability system